MHITVGVMLLLASMLANAEGHKRTEGHKVGFVNVNLLVQKIPQATEATKRLEDAFGQRKNEILDFQQKCKSMEQEFERESVALSQQQKQRELRKIRSCGSELKLMDEEYGADLRIAQGEELQKLQKLVYKTIDEIASSENYDLIVNESVIYASPGIDISLKVLHKLEKDAAKEVTEGQAASGKP